MVSEDIKIKLYNIIEMWGSHDLDYEEVIFWYALYSLVDVTDVLEQFTASMFRGKD
jgi:hypothetical protein